MRRLLPLKSFNLFLLLMLSTSSANAWWDCNWSKRVLVIFNQQWRRTCRRRHYCGYRPNTCQYAAFCRVFGCVVGSGPVKFTQGTPTSGLSYTFNLASGTDDVSFSNNSGTSYVYTPVNTGGFDANVTNFSINSKNAVACSTTGNTPTAQFEFDVGIK